MITNQINKDSNAVIPIDVLLKRTNTFLSVVLISPMYLVQIEFELSKTHGLTTHVHIRYARKTHIGIVSKNHFHSYAI